jgi:hypothetical protein
MLNFISFEGRKMSNPTYQGLPGSPTQVAAVCASVVLGVVCLLAAPGKEKVTLGLVGSVLTQFVLLRVIEGEREKIEETFSHGSYRNL